MGTILRPMPNYMTRKQYDRHREATKECELKLDEARLKVGKAAEHGDLSENAEYDAAVEESAFLSGRHEELKSMLVGCEVVEPHRTVEGIVSLGKTIDVRQAESGEEATYHIVGNGVIDSEAGEVSFLAPLGGALLGKKVGEVAAVKLPDGNVDYEILEIRYSS